MASKVNLDVAEKLDITCRRGDSFSLSLTLKDSAGDALTLESSNYEFLMDVKGATTDLKGIDGSPLDALSNGFVFSAGTDAGLVTVTATANVMKQLPPGRYVYDIQQKVSETVTTILRGSFKVNEDISD